MELVYDYFDQYVYKIHIIIGMSNKPRNSKYHSKRALSIRRATTRII